MGKVIEEEDELLELSEGFDADDEALGIEDADELGLGEIEEGPEEIGLDVETLGSADGLDAAFDDELDGVSALDDSTLELGSELDEEGEEDGWTEESEGTSGSWDDDLLDDEELADADGELDEDGGLEGLEDIDDMLDELAEEGETSFSIEGDDRDTDEELERVELDLG